VSFISRGFHGRRDDDVDPQRVPPGHYVTHDVPVLSAGPTPHTLLEEWTFSIVNTRFPQLSPLQKSATPSPSAGGSKFWL
jgi:hypothetical protein